MPETKIKKLNLKALQSSGEQSIKEDIVPPSSKPAPVVDSALEKLDSNSHHSNDSTKERTSSTKISIASIKKAPVKKEALKKEEEGGNINDPLHNIKKDEEKNITELRETYSPEIEGPKNNNTSVNQSIKEEAPLFPSKDSDKNPSQEKNIAVIDANKQKNNINENFKEEVLSENEQKEIIEKTLKEEKSEKKGIFSRMFSNKKKTHTSKKEPFDKTKEENKEIHFENYTSDFEKKSKNILKRVQNFKYTPQTRKGLVIGLISLTFLIIGGLMIFFPEKHSLEIYKASILEMTHKKNEDSSNIESNLPITLPQSDQEEIIEPPTSLEDGLETGETYVTQEEENKEKLRNYLLDRYKK